MMEEFEKQQQELKNERPKSPPKERIDIDKVLRKKRRQEEKEREERKKRFKEWKATAEQEANKLRNVSNFIDGGQKEMMEDEMQKEIKSTLGQIDWNNVFPKNSKLM